MKNNILPLLVLLFFTTGLKAQQWSGSSNLNGLLLRNGNIRSNGFQLGRYGSPLSGDSNPYTISSADSEAHDLTVYGNSAATLHLRVYDGNIKMGSGATPNTVIYNDGRARFGRNTSLNGLLFGRYGNTLSGDSNPYTISSADSEAHDLTVYGNSAATLHLRVYDGDIKMGSGATPNTVIYNDGKATFKGQVGIGTSNPRQKLDVNGTIRAREIRVEASPWPDYVFEEDYDLPSLDETEKFIAQHKHLPEIPSAKEVENNGIALGEMNAKLLQKIEELTLHLIEQDKRIKTLENKLNQQQK